ncbi:hypothetical protein FH972_010512 [Carpinus fangiana]|uniref:Phytocyanin domain-containing protein n=1 Tax=Carpinus fangiana TaxID=176857 RepID=A0A660KNJ5_9ROSI|nr:hypothetical protein FH972_010512 [Carpinus fangiana]
MAALRDSFIILDVVMVMVVAQLFGFTHGCWSGCPSACPPGFQYQVGSSVWSIPPSPHYYTNWSSSQSFRTGDSLRFGFETGNNDVIQVTRQEYESCTACNPIKVLNNGPAIVPLTERGVFYFISNFSNYCALGLKLSVKVHDCPRRSPRTPPPSPSPLPAPPSSSPVPSPRARGGSNPPVPSPNYGYPPEAAAPSVKSMASMLSGFRRGSSETLFGWAFELCLVVFAIL